jgi:hypothetical protein
MILYVSFLEIIKALNNFKSMLPKENTQEVIDTLELLDYFLATSKIKDTTFSGNLTLKTNSDKLFFIALIDYINEMNAKK